MITTLYTLAGIGGCVTFILLLLWMNAEDHTATERWLNGAMTLAAFGSLGAATVAMLLALGCML